LALWVVLPALAADLARGRTSAAVRPWLAALLAVGVAMGLAAATARVVVLDQLGWDRLLGRQPAGLGEALSAVEDGRALRPRLRRQAEILAAGVALARQRQPAASLRVLAPLLDGREDYTSDDREVGVPQYWAALDLLATGDRGQAVRMAAAAAAVRPEDARLAALATRLARPREAPLPLPVPPAPPAPLAAPAQAAPPADWRPLGCDPVSARMALAAAAAADGDRAAAMALLRPLAADFPELLPGFGRAQSR
ncbi:MAG TPA: hypothetical protein VE075_06000, partial [Thermoanaerobaculia bacterium]|nr:hypothetical protein [Thermoanaerobaculia bacterium]